MSAIKKSISLYIKNLYLDYYEVFKDVHKSAKRQPLKAGFIALGTAFGFNLFISNEGLRSYNAEIIEACNKVGALVDNSRNPKSYEFVQKLGELKCERRLKGVDLGFSTLIYWSDSDSSTALYKHNCKYTRPSIKEFVTERIIDWGVLGHWFLLEYKMRDYDINEADLQRSIIENNKIGDSFKTVPA